MHRRLFVFFLNASIFLLSTRSTPAFFSFCLDLIAIELLAS